MEPLDETTCRQILEVGPETSPDEVAQAYHRLKRFYQDDRSPVTAPSMDEFCEEARQTTVRDLDRAFAWLSHRWETSHPRTHPAPPPPTDGHAPTDGPSLRRVREAEGLTLDYIASQTHVRPEFLSAFEEERFADLPHAAVNVRGFLTAFVMELGLSPEAVVPAYMQRFLQWQGGRAR